MKKIQEPQSRPQTPHKIRELWIFLGTDKNGSDILIMFKEASGLLAPAIASDEERLNLITPIMQKIAAQYPELNIRLVKACEIKHVKTISFDSTRKPFQDIPKGNNDDSRKS